MIACEICDHDVLKFPKVYNEVKLGDALIVYSKKLESKDKTEKNKFKTELMKLDMIGIMITGQDAKLLEKFEMQIEEREKPAGDESLLLSSGFEII